MDAPMPKANDITRNAEVYGDVRYVNRNSLDMHYNECVPAW